MNNTFAKIVRRCRSVIGRVRRVVKTQGGVWPAAVKTLRIMRTHGVSGLVYRLRRTANVLPPNIAALVGPTPSISFRPFYLNPLLPVSAADIEAIPSVAVHLHLYYEDMAEHFKRYLANLPCAIDLYVSVRETADCERISQRMREALKAGSNVFVEEVPNRGRDIAPLIIQFGARLLNYEIVGHIHSKKSPHSEALSNWLTECMDLLFGRPGSDGRELTQIFKLLADGAKVVYPQGSLALTLDPTGWSNNYEMAGQFLKKYTKYRIEDFPAVEFPQGTMFWARSDKLVDYLKLPLSWQDFPAEPIAEDETLAHVLERLILLMTVRHKGSCIKLCRRDSTDEYPYFEDQMDFAAHVPQDAPKVLAYYLPQFHPTPENDEWHGAGFTEWFKVRTANPLFPSHYQQHIPHPDIGYYLLDSPETLERQADLMKKSGVWGQIFYHYWFGGKLILEKPAQMLLANPQIDMPYCFCWANENWTRRWDGNENEILLGQDYSDGDAAAFIRYLLPFFRDPRYIRIDGRPVLMVYRAAHMPDAKAYVQIWGRECETHGLPKPYVIAVLTRGASDPRDFGMDAGTERVLHDWTGGACPEIAPALPMFDRFNGSVLNYDDVANFYMRQDEEKPYPFYRSLVPIWDNTARYGSEAYVVHGSTPSKFQAWLERLIQQSIDRQPADGRFVVVNAWNEWAEGAHLEPDTLYGYAYLNSVGRALTGEPFGHLRRGADHHLQHKHVVIDLSGFAEQILDRSPRLRHRFLSAIANSTLLQTCKVSFSNAKWSSEIEALRIGQEFVMAGPKEWTHRLLIGRPSLFGLNALEEMVRMSVAYPYAVILANAYGTGEELNAIGEAMSVGRWQAHTSPLRLFPRAADGEYKAFKICPAARAFVAPPDSTASGMELPVVTTVIRIHRSASLDELTGCLLSLLAMRDCIVVPYIAAQDFSAEMKKRLASLVAAMPWDSEHPPIVRHYQSPTGEEDLRSTLLNESLRAIQTRYAAILDYDDLLFPDAYATLLQRLRESDKAVTFGRVYCAIYDSNSMRILERRRIYEGGKHYLDFLQFNHAPIHSFMMDLQRIDLHSATWHDDQKYMEDYHLTLQIFTAQNGDWASLQEPRYVGDYIYKTDASNTLGITDDVKRNEIIATELYQRCESRIIALQRSKWE